MSSASVSPHETPILIHTNQFSRRLDPESRSQLRPCGASKRKSPMRQNVGNWIIEKTNLPVCRALGGFCTELGTLRILGSEAGPSLADCISDHNKSTYT